MIGSRKEPMLRYFTTPQTSAETVDAALGRFKDLAEWIADTLPDNSPRCDCLTSLQQARESAIKALFRNKD